MTLDRKALILVTAIAAALAGREIATATAAPVLNVATYQALAAVPATDGMSLLWLMGSDGRIKLCRGYAKLKTSSADWDVACSPGVQP